jgi:UDP-glucose 4-epimerase
MKLLVTGSAGHLGEALVRTLRDPDHEVVGLDILESPFTTHIGSIAEHSVAMHCMSGVQVVFLARSVGSKGYHDKLFSQGPYLVE